jgi:hypothetical protein
MSKKNKLEPNKRFLRGVTLMEMVTVIAITTLVGGALTRAIQFFYKSNAYLLEQTSATTIVRRGMTDAVQLIREASYAADGSYPLKTIGTSTLTFSADMNNDGNVENIRYYLTNGTLYRGVKFATGTNPTYVGQPESTTTIATSVRNSTSSPIFTYYDSSGIFSTSTGKIASIGIMLLVDINPLRAPNVLILSQTTTIRNLQN